MRKPAKGEQMYIPNALHVYRERDDFAGGKATIDKIEYNDYLPKTHINYIMVGFKENPGTLYNWINLVRKQKELAKKFKNQVAHAEPDYSQEFNPPPHQDWKHL